MEPEGSLPCSQEPATGHYPELHASSPHLSILFLLKSILILSSHLRLGLPNGLFPSGRPTKILYVFLFTPVRATFPAHLVLLDLITVIIFLWSVQVMKLLIMQSSPPSRHFLPPRSKYSQHRVLKHP
jgi:hypothetical protein